MQVTHSQMQWLKQLCSSNQPRDITGRGSEQKPGRPEAQGDKNHEVKSSTQEGLQWAAAAEAGEEEATRKTSQGTLEWKEVPSPHGTSVNRSRRVILCLPTSQCLPVVSPHNPRQSRASAP